MSSHSTEFCLHRDFGLCVYNIATLTGREIVTNMDNAFVLPLLKLLNDDNNSIEDIAKSVVRSFPISDRFKAACTLSMLVSDNLLPFSQVSV